MNINSNSLEEYKTLEVELHRDLMNCCRKYMRQLGIISIVGVIDLVKQETVELSRAAQTQVTYELDEKKETNPDFKL